MTNNIKNPREMTDNPIIMMKELIDLAPEPILFKVKVAYLYEIFPGERVAESMSDDLN